ncbi:MAG TPA: hypothetical protein VHX49_08655, partial [Candidatus Acidoferrales bacterium]|nr:hypothetical protein [Candidatus Acidoferrales bacterium]
PLRLKETFELIAKTRGEDVAQALLIDNPLAAFQGRPLPWVPELPEGFGMDEASAKAVRQARRKRFFFF